jgi:hypothetical protein
MTENDFNSNLSKEIRKLAPKVHYLKVSDKFGIGISDFLIWRDGTCAAVEVKYITEYPNPNVQLLKHPFKGSQITFLESISLTGNRAFGIVGVGKDIYLIPWKKIPPNGNWQTQEFVGFKSYPKIKELLDGIFG